MSVLTVFSNPDFRCCLLFTCGLWGLLGTPVTHGQVPVVHRLETSGCTPGTPATIVVIGQKLQNTNWLWTEAGLFAPAEGHDAASEKRVTFVGEVTESAAAGICEARVISAGGCSTSIPLIIDSLAVTPATAESEASSTGQSLPFPTTVQTTLNPVKPRRFKVTLPAATQVFVQVFARRLNSDLDSVITVYSSSGKEVAFCDDTPGLEGDAELSFTAKAAGDYTFELRDVAYRGGERHFAHLRIADSYLDTFPSSNDAAGDALAALEPNEEPDAANLIASLPCHINGTLSHSDDADWFRFTLKEQTPVCITSKTHTLNSPVDLILRLHGSDGKVIEESDEAAPRDASIFRTLPPGDYFLQATDRGANGGSLWNYEIFITNSGILESLLTADRVIVPKAGSTSIPIKLTKRQYGGPVAVSVNGLPDGIRSPELILGARQVTVPLTFFADSKVENANIRNWAPCTLNVSAPADAAVLSDIFIAPRVRKKSTTPFRTAREGRGFFCVSGPQAEFVLTSSATTVDLTAGTKSTIPVSITRHSDWSMPVDVTLAVPAEELPPGVKIGPLKLEGENGTLELTTEASTAPETFTLFLQGTAKKDKTTVTRPVNPITVTVMPVAPEVLK